MQARPKKNLGQHFLHEMHTIDRLLHAIAPRSKDVMVEIGPGEGALSLPLLESLGKLVAIELDEELIPQLEARAVGHGKLTVIHANALKMEFTALSRHLGVSRIRLIGNLPYYLSSPLLFHCLGHSSAITDMHFMLQKEVVDRMAAPPGSKVYGRLSVMTQLACRIEPLFEVPPKAFRPPPKVNSTVVRLLPFREEERFDADPARLSAIVKAAFAQRRKTLGNALGQLLDSKAISAAHIDPRTRAETLTPGDFVQLAKRLP